MLKKFRIKVDKVIEVENDEDFDWDGYVYDEAINYIERQDIDYEDVTEKRLNDFLNKHFNKSNFLKLMNFLEEETKSKTYWIYDLDLEFQKILKDYKYINS